MEAFSMKYLSIGKFAKYINTPIYQVRRWDNNNILKPAYKTDSGTRYYTQQQVIDFYTKWNLVFIKNLEDDKLIGEVKNPTIKIITCIEDVFSYLINLNTLQIRKLKNIYMVKPVDTKIKQMVKNLNINLVEVERSIK
jgi:hypothetical protein